MFAHPPKREGKSSLILQTRVYDMLVSTIIKYELLNYLSKFVCLLMVHA